MEEKVNKREENHERELGEEEAEAESLSVSVC